MLSKTGARSTGLPALRTSAAIRAAGWRTLYVLVIAAAAGLLYGRVLAQPLYWDDARHYFIATENSFLKLWLNDTGYAYYRPAAFTLYKLAFTYLTPAYTWLCYASGLLLHVAASLLAGSLAAGLVRFIPARAGRQPASPDPARWLASALFLAYPFAIYVVGNFAALMHLAVMTLNLAGALAAVAFVRSGGKRGTGVMLTAALLAPLFHESGVVTGPLLALVTVVLDSRLAWRRRLRLAWLLVAAGLYLAIWIAVPKGRAEGAGLMDPETMFKNLTFFVEGLTYPLQPVAGLLMKRWSWIDLAAVWAVALPTLGLFALATRKTGGRILSLGAGWFLLAALPSVALLPSWYVIPAPRLLYAVAPAAVLLCTAGCLAIGQLLPARASRAGGMVVAAGILAFSAIFVAGKVSLFQVSLAPLRELAAVAERDPNQRHLVINPPKWTASVSDPYALGSMGVSILPDYVLLNEVVEINSATRARFDGAFMPPLYWAESQEARMWGPYHEEDPWDPARLAENVFKYDHVWVTAYTPAGIGVEEVGFAQRNADREPASALANFEGQIWLTAGQYTAEGQTVTITLDWLTRTSDRGVTVFRHVLDCQGHMLGAADGHPLGRALPFGYLPAGTRLHDIRTVALGAPSPDGCYAVEAGLYRPDGSRLTASSGSGSKLPDGAAPIGLAQP